MREKDKVAIGQAKIKQKQIIKTEAKKRREEELAVCFTFVVLSDSTIPLPNKHAVKHRQ